MKNKILVGEADKKMIKTIFDEWENVIGTVLIFAKDGRLLGNIALTEEKKLEEKNAE